MPVTSPVLVGMAEIAVLKGQGQFTCLGLGSCIGLCAIDPITNVGGMVHVMLPEAFADRPVDKIGKFANTGVPQLIKELEKLGAVKSRLKLAMAGGAQVFKFGDGSANRLDIGNRNTIAVKKMLQELGLKAMAEETGGHSGRTMIVTIETGEVKVRTVAEAERLLCNLRK